MPQNDTNQVRKPSSQILEHLRKCSAEHNDEVFTRLYRYLLREDIYIASFQNLYANKGAMTKGIDNDTASGFGMDYVESLIDDLQKGTYRAKPVRRTYIPKKNGKLRPLGIPSFRDKLLQDVVRMYLEAIYEPLFSNFSHGFRPDRSCHTAFAQIKKTFNGVPWIIEGDISHCFDDIDHGILIQLLSKKIKDNRFLQVIREFLKAGYLEDWTFHETYSGAAQGGIVSPILMNIYMNELDKEIGRMAKEFSLTGDHSCNLPNHEYTALSSKIQRLNLKISRASKEDRANLQKQRRELQKKLRTTPSKTPTMKKLVYVRYADDWLCGVHGSKADCEEIKAHIGAYLKDALSLTLSSEKTLITHSDKKVRFLGYDISVSRSQAVIPSKSKGYLRRSLYKHVMLSAPMEDKIIPFLLNKQAVRIEPDGTLRPIGRPKLMGAADVDIVRTYNSEIRGILNYYNMAGNYYLLAQFRYLMERSCLYTLARKHNKSARQIIEMYRGGHSWSIPYRTKTGEKKAEIVTLNQCKRAHDGSVDCIREYQPYTRKELWWRIAKNKCECCGVLSEKHCKVFTVRRLKDLGAAPWEVLMKSMRRKTLIVCPACFNLINSSISEGDQN